MAKTKPIQKTIKNKTKPAKTVKTAKKNDKQAAKKSVIKAKTKLAKAAPVVAVKKSDLKKEKVAVKIAPGPTKNNAKANVSVAEKPSQKVIKADVKTELKQAVKQAVKQVVKIKTKSKKVEKKPEEDIESDLIGDDEFGESEIAEYEEDLKAVEDDEEDTVLELTEDDEDADKKDEEVYLTDSEGRRLCKVRDCDQVAAVEVYCRYHYLLLWKKIQIRKQILNDDKLVKYIEDLTTRYTDKFLDVMKKDLKTEKDFLAVIQEMELDENALSDSENESEDEVQSFADEIRGIGEAPAALDDDGDF